MANSSYIRVKIGEKLMFLFVEDIDAVTLDTFAVDCVKRFQMRNMDGKSVQILDHVKTPIDNNEILQHLLRTFNSTGSSYFELKFGDGPAIDTSIITSEVLADYLRRNGGSDVLAEYETTGQLTNKKRNKFITILVEMMIKKHGFFPSRAAKESFGHAAIKLFPIYAVDSSSIGGIDLFYRPSNQNNPGWIVTKLKTLRQIESAKGPNVGNLQTTTSDEIEQVNEAEQEQLLEQLRIMVLSDQTIGIAKTLLDKTEILREKLVQEENVNLLTHFPYFFTCPKLIEYEFSKKFNNIDDQMFSNKWKRVRQSIQHVLVHHGQHRDFSTPFEGEIRQILMLLKLLPEKPCGRKTSAKRSNFVEATDTLILFTKVGIDPYSMVSSNKQPFIMAIGFSPNEIHRYFIKIDGHPINVPADFTFGETFDLLFKVYHVFNLEYPPPLQPLLSFIQHFFYKITEKPMPTNNMTLIFNELEHETNAMGA